MATWSKHDDHPKQRRTVTAPEPFLDFDSVGSGDDGMKGIFLKPDVKGDDGSGHDCALALSSEWSTPAMTHPK
jgi:hypothetical protein